VNRQHRRSPYSIVLVLAALLTCIGVSELGRAPAAAQSSAAGFKEAYVNLLNSLNLSDGQKEQIRALRGKMRADFANQDLSDPAVRGKMRDTFNDGVRKILTPAQRAKYDVGTAKLKAQYASGSQQ
jgi:Spy/CpxP family protein refolding chaperone